MKYLIAIIVAVVGIWLSFTGINHFIHWCTSGLHNPDLRWIANVVLWFWIGIVALIIAVSFVLAIANAIAEYKPKRKYGNKSRIKTLR